MQLKNNMRYTDKMVTFFTGGAPFSNFYFSPLVYKGHNVKTAEQAFMIEKAITFGDESKILPIVQARSAAEAKKVGRTVRNFNPKVWDEKRYGVMVDILKIKFQNPTLKEILLRTDNLELVEGSPYDAIWGVKLDWMSDEILDRNNWRGRNLLGKALMEVREYYRNQI